MRFINLQTTPMEHEEIDLQRKQNNSRETKGRFGYKTNKTLKFDWGVTRKKFVERESITIIDTENQQPSGSNSTLDLGVGISLNAHKNWELLDRSSQDDTEVDYRVVDLEFDPRFNKTAQRVEIYHRIYGANKVKETDDNDNKEEPEYVSGSNRKGHFVRQKRKPGKKGVKNYADTENNNNNTNNNNNKEQNSKSHSSGSDSDGESAPQSSKIVLVQRHNPKTNYHLEQYPTSWSYRCTCETCVGVVDNKERRRQAQRDIEALDLSAL